jgi:hypothetical protein
LKKKDELEKLEDSSVDIFHPNLYDTYYPNRPDDMEAFVLYYLASNYDYRKKRCEKKRKPNTCCKSLKNSLG